MQKLAYFNISVSHDIGAQFLPTQTPRLIVLMRLLECWLKCDRRFTQTLASPEEVITNRFVASDVLVKRGSIFNSFVFMSQVTAQKVIARRLWCFWTHGEEKTRKLRCKICLLTVRLYKSPHSSTHLFKTSTEEFMVRSFRRDLFLVAWCCAMCGRGVVCFLLLM